MRIKSLQLTRVLRTALLSLLLGATGMMKGYAYYYNFSAECPTGQTLYYNIIDAENHYVELTNPGVGQFGWNGFIKPSGQITIPSTVTNNEVVYTVSTIGNWAFYGCSNLNGDLVIPESVTTIGQGSFCACSFTSLTLGNSVTTIGVDAFSGCSFLIGSLVIPNSVTMIGSGAFHSCCGFTSIISFAETPPSFYSGTGVFYNWSNSTPVYVPCGFEEAYASLSWGEFDNFIGMCSGGTVTTEVYPSVGGTVSGGGTFAAGETCTVTAIPNEGYIFGNWTQNGVVVSFNSSYSFFPVDNSVMVAHFVPTGNIAFADDNVKSICVSHWDTNGDGELSYVEAASVTDLNYYFQNNTQITTFNELQYFVGLSTINGSSAPNMYSSQMGDFYGCSSLTSVALPNTVTKIEYRAFEGCSNLTRAYYSGDIAQWCNITFEHEYSNPICYAHKLYINNSLVTNLVIPASVADIKDYAFYGCTSLVGSLNIPNTVTRIGNSAFQNCSGFSGVLTIGNSVTSIGDNAFYGCSGFIGSLSIPNSVITIGDGAFQNCSGFMGLLTMGNSVTTIGDNAFNNCSNLTGGINIPNSVITIGDAAFRNCTAFWGTLTIGSSVVTIGNSAFHDCTGLVGNIIIPNSVTSIGNYAFGDCHGFTGNLTIGESVETIGNYAFRNCYGLTGSLVIPNSVISLGTYAFESCRGFTGTLTISSALTTIPEGAFYSCYGLSGNLVIPNSVTSIGNQAFYSCAGFTDVLVIPNSVLTVGVSSFQGCAGLPEIIMGNNMMIVGNTAFKSCIGLTKVTLPQPVNVIGIEAFKDCTQLMEVNMLSSTAPSIGYDVFTNNAIGRLINIPCGATSNYSTGYWTEWAGALHEVCGDFTIAVTANPVEGGSVSGAGTYDYAETCSLTATPNNGYHFVNWTKGGVVVSTDAIYSFSVFESGTYTANFALNVYLSAIGVNPEEGGTIQIEGTGVHNSTMTFTAIPNIGYSFVNWTKNGEVICNEPVYTFTITESAAYQANFVQQSFHFTTAGNWSVASNWLENELPGSTDQVFINANCTLDTNAEAVALTLDSDIVLTIQETNILSISGTITTPSTTSLIIADGGQLVTGNAVNGIIQKSILGYGESEDGYYFIASPVDDFDPNDGGLLTSNYDLYYFDQTQEGEEWRNYEAASFNLNTGKGYLYASQTDVTLNISGELTAAKDPVELVNQTGVAFEGWNLIGNPYPCNVTINVPFYRMYSDGSGLATQTTNLETTAIKPMEGVFVQYTTEAPSVTFTKAPNVSAEGSRGALNLSLGQGRGVKDNAIIRFDGGKTLEKFNLRKGSSIFITEGNKDYAVVNAEKQGEVPISFKAEKNGSYTLSFSNEDVEFSYLHLIDNMTGNDVDLLHTPSYSFEAKTTDYASRFRLVFSTDGNANDESFGFVNAMGNFCIYGIEGDATVQVIDAMGRILSSETFSGSYEKQLGGAAGVYVVRLINGDSVRTQKIVVR